MDDLPPPLSTQRRSITLGAVLFLTFWGVSAFAHGGGEDPRYQVLLPWQSEEISRVIGLGRSLGLRGRGETRMQEVAERPCMVGPLLGFDVADEFAFDIDETVELVLELDSATSPETLTVGYDGNGTANDHREAAVPRPREGEPSLVRLVVPLERARFAGRGSFATDLAVAAPWGQTFTLCDLRLQRSRTKPPPAAAGTLKLRIVDAARGQPTPARVGLYDSTGRMPLPGSEALSFSYFYEPVKQAPIRYGSPWPVANRYVFYVDGSYSAPLPAGDYELVVAKGLEYRIARQRFTVTPGATQSVEVKLERWTDMPAHGWYTGDAHIHITRRAEENEAILVMTTAEDLHVANLLQIGNVQTTYFEQYAWGGAGRFGAGRHLLVSGQEDPTTGHRGHTISLNLQSPVRNPDHYFLYHRAFEEAHRQGALSGYAHLSAGWFHIERGLALDVPFDIVDFVEVLQIGLLDVELWYPFLDLGFKMVPVAGSDYPYIDLPGTVRNYVQVEGPFSSQAWFDGLEAGRTFATNGPLLSLTVNGQGMGSELAVEAGTVLQIEAAATINPDIDHLARLELIIHGAVAASREVAKGAEQLALHHTVVAEHGMWIAVRAYGTYELEWNQVAAHSAPVYVSVGGDRSWKREAVAEIVTQQHAYLDALLEESLVPEDDLMYWRTADTTLARWQAQRTALARRIEEAHQRYRALAAAAAAEEPGATDERPE